MDMANNLLALRNSRKLSLQKLAELTGYSAQYLNKLENESEGKRLNTDVLSALSKALGCTMSELLAESVASIEINLELFAACSAAIDRGLAFMGVNDLTQQEYAIAVAKTYNAGVDGGYSVPVVDKAYIEKTLEEVRETA